MDSFVFAAVLIAAACHASWNALIKIRLDPFLAIVLIAALAGVVSLPLLLFVPVPPLAAWPWLIASVITHTGYYIGLGAAYRSGDMGQVYPIARGSAPLLTATATTAFVGEYLGLAGWLGIILLAAGVLLLSLRGSRELVGLDRRAVPYALLTAVTICAYSVVDGIGARQAGSANAYSVALFIGTGVVMVIYALMRGGWPVLAAAGRVWGTGIAGGALQLGSYGIAIWAMTVAPIAIVAALRETSVLFGAIIAVVVLREPLRAGRIVAALLIVAGLVLIRLY